MSNLSDVFKERQKEEQKNQERADRIARRKEKRRIGLTGRIGLAVTLGTVLVATPLAFSAVAGEGIDWNAFSPAGLVQDGATEQVVSESSLDDNGMFAYTEAFKADDTDKLVVNPVQNPISDDTAEKVVVSKNDITQMKAGIAPLTAESDANQSADLKAISKQAITSQTYLMRQAARPFRASAASKAYCTSEPAASEVKQGQLIVEMVSPQSDESDLSEALANTEMSVSNVLMASTEEFGGIYLVDVPEDSSLSEARRQIAQNEGVASVYYDFILQEDDDSLASDLNITSKWETAADILDFNGTWQTARSAGWHDSSDVTIAVLDTGIIAHHSDLADNIVATYDATGESGMSDLSGHGTAVAGIASACTDNGIGTASLAYNAKLLPIQVFRLFSDGNGNESVGASLSDVLAGLDWLLTENPDLGGKTPAEYYNVRVANLSLGTPFTSDMDPEPPSAIMRAWNKGVVVVNSIGNATSNTSLPYNHWPTTPAKDYCIGVIAVDRDENNVLRRYPNSNYNLFTDNLVAPISAPGAQIYTTNRDGGYRSNFSGTSAAAPQVSSLLALMFSLDPSLTPSQAMSLMCYNAKEVPGSNNRKEVGWGMIDPAKTIQGVVEGLDPSENTSSGQSGNGGETPGDTGNGTDPDTPSGDQRPEAQFMLPYIDSVEVGKTASVAAVRVPDGAGTVSYVSDNPSILTVNSQGTITGIRVGTATITVSTSGGEQYRPTSQSVTITVIASNVIIRVPSSLTLSMRSSRPLGAFAMPLSATSSLVYASNDPSVATVDAQGKVTGIKPGQTQITVSLPDNTLYNPASATINVTVFNAPGVINAPNSKTLKLGTSENIGATAPEGTSALTYASSDPAVATVDNQGVVTPQSVGSTTITISSSDGAYYDGTSTTVAVTVDKANTTINASDQSVAMGNTVSLNAIVNSAGTPGSLSYTSQDTSIAKVSNNGIITPINIGQTKITIKSSATDSSNEASKTVIVKVNKGTASITASNQSVTMGSATSIGAKVNSGAANLMYTSENPNIAKVSNNGTITPVKSGKVKIKIESAGNSLYGKVSRVIELIVKKKVQPMIVQANTKTAKSAIVKMHAITVAPLSVSKMQGKVTYSKISGTKDFTVNKNNGAVTIKKGTKKGTYKIKIKVDAAGNDTYSAGNKTVEATIKVS